MAGHNIKIILWLGDKVTHKVHGKGFVTGIDVSIQADGQMNTQYYVKFDSLAKSELINEDELTPIDEGPDHNADFLNRVLGRK
jgi:hypothetical protein